MNGVEVWSRPLTNAQCLAALNEEVTIRDSVRDYTYTEHIGGWPGYHTHFTPLPPIPSLPSEDKP